MKRRKEQGFVSGLQGSNERVHGEGSIVDGATAGLYSRATRGRDRGLHGVEVGACPRAPDSLKGEVVGRLA